MVWFYQRYGSLSLELLESGDTLNIAQQLAVEFEGKPQRGARYPIPKNAQQPAVESEDVLHRNGRTHILENAQQFAVELLSLPWGHHQLILGKTKKLEQSLFYVHESFVNGWSRAVLANFIKSDLFARQGQAITNFEETLIGLDSDLA